jgi:hypothetical protein
MGPEAIGPSNPLWPPDDGFGRRAASQLPDVLIRAALIGVLGVLCYIVFAAVTLYPLYRWRARKIGGKPGLAATIVVGGGVPLIVTPTALLMNSFGSSIHRLGGAVQQNTLEVPAQREGIESGQWNAKGDYADGLPALGSEKWSVAPPGALPSAQIRPP